MRSKLSAGNGQVITFWAGCLVSTGGFGGAALSARGGWLGRGLQDFVQNLCSRCCSCG